MDSPFPFEVQTVGGDIRAVKTDIVALKFAGRLRGADHAVAETLGIEETLLLKRGEHNILRAPPGRIVAPEVLFLGVGDIHDFRYEQIRKFAKDIVLVIRKERPSARSMAMTIHGVNYGLDEREAVLSLCAGLADAGLQASTGELRTIYLVEHNERMRLRVADWIRSFENAARPLSPLLLRSLSGDPITDPVGPRGPGNIQPPPKGSRDNLSQALEHLQQEQGTLNANNILQVGARSENKPHIFVAMPFSEDYLDEWEIGLLEPANAIGFLCERMDAEVFTGDVLSHIKQRIDSCSLLIGILTGENPNVYLEIGYAWGRQKPTVLAVRDGHAVRFDVQGQRHLRYKNISELRSKISKEMAGLKKLGII